jgi:hypothetical protein
VKNSLDPCQLLAMHHQTALLESVGWNEKEFTELVKHVTNYLNHKAQNSKDIKYNDITLLLESVHNFWGPDSKEVSKPEPERRKRRSKVSRSTQNSQEERASNTTVEDT